jgi:copper oxidase (laccase) domain-containing protein
LRYPQQAGGEADAILAPLRVPESVLLGIQTADCVPIILTAENGVALIHAGWRGFAQGIVEQVCSALFSEFGKITSASIGPCAGGQRYEVGREVIVDIGESRAVYKTDAQTNSCYLDMQSSVAMVLSSYVDPEMIWKANACTISDVAFHSYRREGKTAGRNLSFVVLYPS